jgi:cyclopropane-fatty-acyl-phospholipid synthase
MQPGHMAVDNSAARSMRVLPTQTSSQRTARRTGYARESVVQKGLQGRVLVEDLDYRDIPGRFDKIASVGMYEHVGRHRLGDYFRTLAHLLEPDGILLNHGIARPQGTHDDGSTVFLQQHVFPGGELPELADIIRSAERAGLEVLDVENLRPHYALTCAAWVSNLMTHRNACLALVDAATYRTWLLYLAAAAVSFERGQTDLYQTLLAKRSPQARRRLARTYLYAGAKDRSSPGSR